MRWRVVVLALLVDALVVPGAANAKGGTCVHTTALGGWTFVLQKISLKPGSSGSVSGYAVADDDTSFEPISGGFMVTPAGFLDAGITRYLSLYNGNTVIDHSTTFHQVAASLDGMVTTGNDLSWTREGNGSISSATGDTQLISCANVPAIPTQPL